MWQPQPQIKRPNISAAIIASVKKMNPALTTPRCSVYIASDGSIGETVVPDHFHWTKWMTISAVKVVSTIARHLLAREWTTPFGLPAFTSITGSSRLLVPVVLEFLLPEFNLFHRIQFPILEVVFQIR